VLSVGTHGCFDLDPEVRVLQWERRNHVHDMMQLQED
jgi:hypothetical protein